MSVQFPELWDLKTTHLLEALGASRCADLVRREPNPRPDILLAAIGELSPAIAVEFIRNFRCPRIASGALYRIWEIDKRSQPDRDQMMNPIRDAVQTQWRVLQYRRGQYTARHIDRLVDHIISHFDYGVIEDLLNWRSLRFSEVQRQKLEKAIQPVREAPLQLQAAA